jgi:hypothetical protein
MAKHAQLEYAVAKAKRPIWMGLLLIEGTIAAFRRDACGRVHP